MSSVATSRHVDGQDPGFRTRGVRHAHLDHCYQVTFQRANFFNTILLVLQNLSHQFLADVGVKESRDPGVRREGDVAIINMTINMTINMYQKEDGVCTYVEHSV